MPDKKKLTLSINSEVIEKAKELGLNLSEITETALKISSLSHEDNKIVSPDKLRKAYVDVLKKISEILKKWDIHLKIGGYLDSFETTDSKDKNDRYYVSFDYFLSPDNVYLWADYSDEEPLQTWRFDDENLPITRFDDPDVIITNLINKIYERAKENKEILEKLQILKNILELSELSK